MTTSPPRLPQLVLSALGARIEIRDAVLGDLAEEYVAHLEIRGERAARIWYAREALRAIPYLTRDAMRHLGIGGIAHVVVAALKAYASIVIVLLILFPLAKPLLHGLAQPRPGTAIVIALTTTILGGYLAARFGRRAPLVSSVTLGAFWTVMFTAGLFVVLERYAHVNTPPWCAFAGPAIIVAGTSLGGVFCVARPRAT